MKDPQRFGVAVYNIIGNPGFGPIEYMPSMLVEKPKEFVSDMAITGLYVYPYDVFSKIEKLSPSDRGELEITDINNMYLAENRLEAFGVEGEWHDAGTPDSLLECSKLVKDGVIRIGEKK